ncbi:MAG: phosphotransferase [Luteitalea sp.]|nr:phosphotransferase [Luteitalea sp.]
MFTARDIVNHLVARGLVSPAAVVRGDIALTDVSRRNRNIKVTVRQGGSYFLKQAVDPSSEVSVAREAEFYRVMSSRPAGAPLQEYLPKYCGYDSEAHLLVLELQPASRDLWAHGGRFGRTSMCLSRKLGRALADLHGLAAPDQPGTSFGRNLTTEMPWVLSVYEPNVAMLGRVSAANLKLVRAIQGHAGFTDSLQRLSVEWRKDRLIHFDIKCDNLVVGRRPASRWTRLTVVDWELVGFGDACWDVGSVFADYLGRWLLSMPGTEGDSSERLSDPTVRQLVHTQRALWAFWQEYVKRMALGQDSDEWLIRSVEYAAARLLQRCYEQLQMSVELPSASVRFLQVSQNMLQRPAEAAVRLLGLPLQRAAL